MMHHPVSCDSISKAYTKDFCLYLGLQPSLEERPHQDLQPPPHGTAASAAEPFLFLRLFLYLPLKPHVDPALSSTPAE